MMTGTELAIRANDNQLAVVENIVAQVLESGGAGQAGHFAKAFRMAAAIRALHHAITDEMMADIMNLQGTTLGFLTDKDTPKQGEKPGYPIVEVKLVAIE